MTVVLFEGTPNQITLTPGDQPGSGAITSNLKDGDSGMDDDVEYDAAIDGLESLVLALFCAGVDVQSAAFRTGLETAIEAIGNNFG